MDQSDPGTGGSQSGPRRKRGQYTNLACYECKKRKTKCNSAHPCSQCAKAGRECTFPPQVPRRRGTTFGPTETRKILKRLSDIENQIRPPPAQLPLPTGLSAADSASDLNSQGVQNAILGIPEPTDGNSMPPLSSPRANSSAPRQVPMEQHMPFGPPNALNMGLPSDSPLSSPYSTNCNRGSEAGTASIYTPATAHYKFNIGLAQTNLLARGVYPPAHNGISGAAFTGANSSRLASPAPQFARPDEPFVDPIWLIDRMEAMRLCNVYEEEINISHPFLDMATIRDNVKTLYDSIDILLRHGCARISLKDTAIIGKDNLQIVKLVFATALITETGGPGSLAKALFDDVKSSTRDKFWEDVTIPTIVIFFLLAMWQFLADNDRLAWRLTGFVARWCLEIGLNQSLFIRQVPRSDHDRKMAVRLFWCIHALDRRWSFGNGLPFVIQDSDIDKNYPEPDDQVPYLKAMVAFSYIMSAVWYASYSSPIDRSKTKGRDEASYLDFRITKWWDELPAELQLGKNDDQFSRGMKRLRILLYLRRCQLKILLHQSVLHSPLLIQEHSQVADGVVQLAKDVIWKLDNLHRSTDIYSTQQMCFNYFLVLSLGVIFLAISQAPDRFARTIQAEFHAALDLVESLSSNSYVSQRLWRFISGLRPLGDRLASKGADQTAHAGEDSEGPVVLEQTQNILEPDLGFLQFTEDAFMPLQPFEEPVDAAQLMESMKSIFEAMEGDWGQGSVQN
ncbi:hypothetical protein B0J15DRAFT_506641 [Fusarium solani]|uniref:Zn(2)-C6 fungal-type domain-containing protein n=1 Tax=Fusarium solani TaxID=169388 RepID=A0A9P9FZC0_FUSSL|nr:uncharacterized protein B0J15DRAFT_506641 [Fusarium solani]KAH7227234.1 hypothetical protein B0J15DRAFT_506641 [Fusarium solani]